MSEQGDFMKFLLDKKTEEEKSNIDWAAKRSEWLSDLRTLTAQVKDWLAPAVQKGLLRVQDDEVQIEEQYLGSYAAPSLVISGPGASRVKLVPIARLIVGAQGRVDLISGSEKFVLVRTKPREWGASVPQAKKPTVSALTSDLLFQLLHELMK